MEVRVSVKVDADLAPPASGKNAVEKFEYSLPFCRGLINTFVDHVVEAEKESGGSGFVTMQALRK